MSAYQPGLTHFNAERLVRAHAMASLMHPFETHGFKRVGLMEKRVFGRTGIPVPVIGLGTWEMEQAEASVAIGAIRRALDAGLTHIDTAEMYGSGAVERLIGRAIAERRNQVFLVSKVMPTNASYDGVIRACERSLKRLGTDYLDAYLLHWPGPHPLEDTLAGFDRLERDGKIRAFGLSNFDIDDLQKAASIVGVDRIACNQVLYHLLQRAIEHRVLPWCQEKGIPIVGYSPFGSGQFADLESDAGRVLTEIGQAHQASPRQVALRFLLREKSTFVIPKAIQSTHIDDNAAAGDLTLSEEDIRRIDEAFPLGPLPASLPIL